MTRKPARPAVKVGHKGHLPRNVKPKTHDTYRSRSKPQGTLYCSDCGAVYSRGKWSWGERPSEARPERCPACRRTSDRYPAGTLHLRGQIEPYREEVLRMIRNVEEREKAEHPLERLMDVEPHEDGLVVTTTGMHLARCIASSIERRFHGHVRIAYGDEENHVQVNWID